MSMACLNRQPHLRRIFRWRRYGPTRSWNIPLQRHCPLCHAGNRAFCSPVLTVSSGLHRRNCAEPHGAPRAQRIWTRQRHFFERQTGRPSNDRLARHTMTTVYTATMTSRRATRKASARFRAFWSEWCWARYCGCRFSGSSSRSQRRAWYSGSFPAMNSRDWLTARSSTISEMRQRK